MNPAIATSQTQKKPGRIKKSDRLILILLTLTVLALSLSVFSHESLRLDEAQSLWQASHSPQAMLEIVAEDVHVPLYHFMLHYWQVMFGSSAEAARTLSLIFYLATIPAVYYLGRFVYNRQVGLFASVLLAISPFLNWYGNEVRMYSLFVLLTVLNTYFFMAIFLRKDEIEAGQGRVWSLYTITALLGIFTHYFFFFNLLTQAFFFFAFRRIFPRKSVQAFSIITVFLALIYAPWIYYVVSAGIGSNTQPILSKPTTIDIFNTFSQFIFGFQDDHINTILVSLWPILVLLIFLSLRHNQRITPTTVYLFCSLFLPILMAFVISATVKPIYLTRYLILSLPSLYLLIGWIISIYPRRLSQALRGLIVIGMTVMLVVEIANANTPVKENYREASAYLTKYAKPQDIIVVSAPFTIYPVEYYYNGPVEISTLPLWNRLQYGSIPAFDENTLPQEVDALRDNHEVLWLLLSYDQGYEEKIRLYFETHYERLAMVNFSPGLNLYAYKMRYDHDFAIDFPSQVQPQQFKLNIDWRSPFESIRNDLQGL